MRKIGLWMLAFALFLVSACGNRNNGGADQEAIVHGEHMENREASVGEDHREHGDTSSSAAAEVTTSAEWKLSVPKPNVAEDTEVTILIRDAKGQPVNEFENNHEKKMHLIVVSKDLSYFNHIHPAYKGGGAFSVTTRFPAAGEYKLIADYIPGGGSSTSQTKRVEVQGKVGEQTQILPDSSLTRIVDGVEATLSLDHLMAGMETGLTFTFADAGSNKPIEDLQPYLGAVGHVVILSEDTELYLHVHPTDEDAKGPEARFMTSFPKSGIYKIWGQFKRNDRTFIVPFVVKVP
ncbi:hypothetical protein [Cohnella lupini]|uniref:YtkA-like protein n=1 Tax=Cohnella lupini TaxID=1294267 RepID=A0A3D9IX89_9BACL|nr:hypothetical protein [Cohnella lupini]RED66274.1 hypothetical protein DFP95_101773 [Cohnella lupini]